MKEKKRLFLPAGADLIDRLTIDQIKETLLPNMNEAVTEEMDKICHDIDNMIEERGIKLTARTIRIIIALSQMNLHIWHMKDRMQEFPEQYNDLLKLAHQLNGIRNQMKNLLLEEFCDADKAAQRTNSSTDGLKNWKVNIP